MYIIQKDENVFNELLLFKDLVSFLVLERNGVNWSAVPLQMWCQRSGLWHLWCETAATSSLWS